MPKTLRRQALYSLTYMKNPVDDAAFRALLSLVDEPGPEAGSDLQTMPLLISGILINHTRRHDPDTAERFNQQLQDALEAATDQQQQSLLVVALGNARQPVNIDVIIPWFQSDLLSAREAAVQEAASYSSAEMVDALADQLENNSKDLLSNDQPRPRETPAGQM